MCQLRAGWQLWMRLWQKEETKGPALLEPGEMEDVRSPSIPTNPEPRAPKTIPATPAAAPQPRPPASPHGKLRPAAGPPSPAGIWGNPLRTSQPKPAAGDFPSSPSPAAPVGPRLPETRDPTAAAPRTSQHIREKFQSSSFTVSVSCRGGSQLEQILCRNTSVFSCRACALSLGCEYSCRCRELVQL